MNIHIYIGLWDHSGNEPVFKCDPGSYENGICQHFDGEQVPWKTTVDNFFQYLEENEGAINLTKEEMIKSLKNTGKAYFAASWHGAHLVKLI
jgi:hypothetical protein